MGKGIKDYAIAVIAVHDIVLNKTVIEKRVEGDADYETALDVQKEAAETYEKMISENDDPSKIVMLGFNEVVEKAFAQHVVTQALGVTPEEYKERLAEETKKAED